MTIGNRTIVILKEKGLTKAGLAKHLNTKNSTIQNWEKSTSNPSSALIMPICEYLNVTPQYLLTGEDSTVPLAEGVLTFDEKELITIYRQLNNLEQRSLFGKASDLLLAKGNLEVRDKLVG